MNKQQVIYILILLSAILTTATCFIKGIYFIIHPLNSNHLISSLLLLVISTLLWFYIYYLKVRNTELTKLERQKALETMFRKLPLILLSITITGVFSALYFFFFAFLTVSSYGKGGMGAKVTMEILFTLTFIMVFIISYFVIKPVLETEESDTSLTVYNLFSKLKWTALIVLPFGIWASYYFYHDQGFSAFIAMIFWDLVFIGIYKGCSAIAKKVQAEITEASVNRILHEKKKKMIQNK